MEEPGWDGILDLERRLDEAPGDVDLEEGESSEEDEDEAGKESKADKTVGERIKAPKEERTLKKLADPRLPTQKEVEEHNRTHLPYRNWCPHCVRALGHDLDHRKSVEEERGLPEFSFDYCFPGDELGYKLTILVGRERTTGMCMGCTIPGKGSVGKYAADKAMEFFQECGYQSGSIIIKTDQEPAIKLLVKCLVEERGDECTLVEEAPVGSKGSNGIVERAVQTIEGQVRVMKLALEDRLGMSIDAEANVMTFLAEYAGYLVNRLVVGKDGKTSYERAKGKAATVMGLEFGEKVLWKTKDQAKMNKVNARWQYGIFVGARARSGELWIATLQGVFKARSVRRLVPEERWSKHSVEWVRNTPWHRYKGQPDADGDIPEDKAVEPRTMEEPRIAETGPRIEIKVREPPPRAFQIRKEDAERHGYTRGCGGCSSWFRGLSRQPHTPECRRRFADLIGDEARFHNAEKRKQEYEEKMRRKKVKKEEREEDRKRKATDELDESDRMGPEETREGAVVEDGPMEDRRSKRKAEGELDETDRMEHEGARAGAAASSGRTSPQREVGVREQEKRERPPDDDPSWSELVDRVKKAKGDPEGHADEEMGIEEVIWDEVIDPTKEEAMIADIRAEEDLNLQEHMEDFGEWAWDDVKHKQLDLQKVKEARKEEVDYMVKKGIWDVVDWKECRVRTGKEPVSVKWVDTDKGIDGQVKVRSRLVARDFKGKDRADHEELFAATPPLEMLRLLISRTATMTRKGTW